MNTVIDEDDSGRVRYADLNLIDMFQYGKMGYYYMKTSEGRLNLMTGIIEDINFNGCHYAIFAIVQYLRRVKA